MSKKSSMNLVRDLKRIALIVWIFVTIWYGLNLWINSQRVGLNQALADMWDRRDKLTLENQLLENEIAEKSSLKYLQKKASESGYIKTEKVLYIK